LEGKILLFIQENIRCDILTPVMKFVSYICNHGEVWILAALILLLMKNTRKCGAAVAIALILSYVVNNLILKNVVERPRPYEMIEGLVPLVERLSDYSFPSGHTGASFAASFVIIKSRLPYVRIPALILAILIACSRLYLGVHYPTDVAAGMVIGIIMSYIACAIISKITWSRQHKKQAQ